MAAPLLETRIRSASREVVIGHETRFCVIGERINPTGRKKLAAELEAAIAFAEAGTPEPVEELARFVQTERGGAE